MRSMSLSEFNDFTQFGKAVVGSIKENYKYADGKRTDEVVSISIVLYSENHGQIQAIFEAKDGLYDSLKSSYPFSSVVKIEDLGTISDIRIAIYNDSLLIKIFME